MSYLKIFIPPFLIAISFLCLNFAGACEPRTNKPKIRQLMKQGLVPRIGSSEEEVTIITVDYPPGGQSGAHAHSGPVFVYILEGEVESQIEGGSPKIYKKGETFFESPGKVHQLSRNVSKTRPAKLLAFLLTKQDQPLELPVPTNTMRRNP
jgi:quercetin dioxygenase-like cupin family protein